MRNRLSGLFSRWEQIHWKLLSVAIGGSPNNPFLHAESPQRLVFACVDVLHKLYVFLKEFFERNRSLTRMLKDNTSLCQGSPGPQPHASLSNARWLRHTTTKASILHAESPQRLVFTVGSNPLVASLSGNWGFAKQFIFACGIASAACFRMCRCSSHTKPDTSRIQSRIQAAYKAKPHTKQSRIQAAYKAKPHTKQSRIQSKAAYKAKPHTKQSRIQSKAGYKPHTKQSRIQAAYKAKPDTSRIQSKAGSSLSFTYGLYNADFIQLYKNISGTRYFDKQFNVLKVPHEKMKRQAQTHTCTANHELSL